MALMDVNESEMGYVKEVTAGVTPATPVFQKMKITGESLKSTLAYESGNEIAAVAAVQEVQANGESIGGGIEFLPRLSQEFEDMLEAALRGTWNAGTLEGAQDDHHFTVERKISAALYHRFAGLRVSSLSLNAGTKAKQGASVQFMGLTETTGTAIILGATYTAASGASYLIGTDLKNVAITGITNPIATSISMEISNELSERDALGSDTAVAIGNGERSVTGTIELYFESFEAYTAFKSRTNAAISFDMVKGGTTYTVTMTKAKLTDYSAPMAAKGDSFKATVNYQAQYDPTPSTDITIVKV